MPLITVGINHKTAPVAIREKVAFAPEKMFDALSSLISNDRAEEAVIVSTCNRTELYCVVPEGASKLLDALGQAEDVRSFAHLNDDHKLVPGIAIPKPDPIFPRFIEPEGEDA